MNLLKMALEPGRLNHEASRERPISRLCIKAIAGVQTEVYDFIDKIGWYHESFVPWGWKIFLFMGCC